MVLVGKIFNRDYNRLNSPKGLMAETVYIGGQNREAFPASKARQTSREIRRNVDIDETSWHSGAADRFTEAIHARNSGISSRVARLESAMQTVRTRVCH